MVFKIDTTGVWVLDFDGVLRLLQKVVLTKFEHVIFKGDQFCIRPSDLRTTAMVLVKLGVFDAHHNPLINTQMRPLQRNQMKLTFFPGEDTLREKVYASQLDKTPSRSMGTMSSTMEMVGMEAKSKSVGGNDIMTAK